MEIFKKILVKTREIGKKSIIKKIIKDNLVPGVIYLKGGKSLCISAQSSDMNSISNDPSALTRIYELELDGKKMTCLLKEMQFNPMNDTVRSVDFMEVKKDDIVKVNVPIRVMNKEICPGVKSGGDIYMLSYNVDLKCKVENIPYAIEIDVKDCNMGQKFFLSDIKLPNGCSMINDTILLRIAGRRVIKEIEVAENADAAPTAAEATGAATTTDAAPEASTPQSTEKPSK